jgi:hypothetical protein
VASAVLNSVTMLCSELLNHTHVAWATDHCILGAVFTWDKQAEQGLCWRLDLCPEFRVLSVHLPLLEGKLLMQ